MKNKNYTNLLPGSPRMLFSRTIAMVCFMALFISGAMAQTAIIGTGTLTASGTNGTPIYRSSSTSGFHHSKSIQLLTAAQLSGAGISAGSQITGWGYNKQNNGAPSGANAWTLNVYLKNSSATVLTSGTSWNTMISGATLAYSATINSSNMPTATGYWVWPTSGFTYTGGAIEAYVEWFPAGTMTSPFTTNSFLWQYTSAGNQAMGTSNSTAIPGTNTSWTTQARFYNTQINYSTTPCVGQPNPGNTIASAPSICTGASVNLSLQNGTSGSGVSYQWQESDDNSTWNNFGPNAPTASFVMGTTTKYFQCIVTCSGDPNPGISNSVQVDVNQFYACYCASNATNPADTKIDSVYLGTLVTGSLASACETYTNNTSLTPPTITLGQTQTMRVRNGSCSGSHFGARLAVYIDINRDGIYQDPAERVFLNAANTTALNSIPAFNFTIPAGGPTGLTGMRVILQESAAPLACGTFTYGETEDYVVDLQPEPPCLEPPTAGNAVSNITQFCNSTTVNLNLSLSGVSGGAGQTYQWQYSFNGADYFDISGATTASWTENGVGTSYYYQCNVTCGSTTVASAPVFVEAVPPPVAGTISGPASGVTNIAQSYSSTGETGSLQWQARLLPSGTFTNVSGATNNPQNIFYSAPGTYEVRLITSVVGCSNATSNTVSTVITIAGDNVCDAVPVTLGVNGPFTNVGATIEAGEAQAPQGPSCNGNSNWCAAPQGTISNTVWFTFTVPTGGSGRYGFAVPGWDSQVAVWSAAACGDLLSGAATLIAANDDSSGSPFNAYARGFCLTEGVTYYVQVDGYGTGTNSAFALRIDDFGPANPSFTGLPATICENAAAVTLTPAVAGGTFSGTGVTGSTFNPSAAGAGIHSVTYTLSGLDACYSSSQSVEVITPTFTYYADADLDTYGNAAVSILSCSAVAPAGYSADNTDCDDNNGGVNPGATEVCNTIDDDCDGQTDEGFDVDGDGFTSCGGDCNDNDNTVFPGATEVCNGVDDDCNLLIDDGLTFVTYYADADGDTYGNAGSTVSTCNGAPAGYVSDNTDCDDNNSAVNPAATEVCNSIDDDCDGLTDENLLVAGPISGPAVQCVAVVTGSATFSISPVFDASSYTWNVPAGVTILSGQGTNSIFVSWTPIAASNGIIGNITVTPSNACGAGTPSSVLMDINYTKPVMPNSISGPVKLCPGDVATYSTNLIARASYFVWSVPTGVTITSGANTNVIQVSVDGSYVGGTISVSGANACGVGQARLRAVTLNNPAAPASISGQASGVCGATGVVYTCATVVGATSYNWSVPAGASITAGNGSNSITVDFTNSYAGGNFSVVAVNACGSSSARTRSVSGAPGQPGPISGDQTICPGQTNVPYSVATVAGASSYTWTVPGIATIASGQGTKDIFVNWGTNPTTGQQVTVFATNSCGSGAVRILNGIGIDLGNCVRIGEAGAQTALNIYPNPATDFATIIFNGTEGADFNLTMVDIAGRVVMTERGTAAEGQNQRNVVVSEMASGIYFVTLQINGVSEQIRVMVD